MRLKNKLSRRAQVISAIVVALVFGCGWLAVWKWQHIKLRYMLARAAPALQKAMATRAKWLAVPESVPADWNQIDLGIVALSVPSPIRKIETKNSKSVSIDTAEIRIYIHDFFVGRRTLEEFRTHSQLRLLDPTGVWRDAGYIEYCHAAGFASSDDFRWTLSLDQVLSLQQLLLFKAMNAGIYETYHFDGPNSKGLMTWAPPGSNVGSGFGHVWIVAIDNAAHDAIVMWCTPYVSGGDKMAAAIVESLRFPAKRYHGSAEDLTRHAEALALEVAATSRPAQP